MPISKHSTLPELKKYVKDNKLKIKLTQKKADLLAELDKGGHIHRGQRTGTITSKNMPKTTPTPVKIDASKKPPLNTKKIEPKKPSQGRKTIDTLLELDYAVMKNLQDAIDAIYLRSHIKIGDVFYTAERLYNEARDNEDFYDDIDIGEMEENYGNSLNTRWIIRRVDEYDYNLENFKKIMNVFYDEADEDEKEEIEDDFDIKILKALNIHQPYFNKNLNRERYEDKYYDYLERLFSSYYNNFNIGDTDFDEMLYFEKIGDLLQDEIKELAERLYGRKFNTWDDAYNAYVEVITSD